jgi:hypothetical protein
MQFDFDITPEKVKQLLIVIAMIATQPDPVTEIKPERITRTATFTVQGKIENVFPLFGPIREKEWAEGWEPEILYRSSESVLVEEHMIFQTNGRANEGKYTWVITQFQPEKHSIEYTVSTSERIWFIRVVCRPSSSSTDVTVSYTYTGLSEEGNKKNGQALARMFADDLKDWEAAINHYLRTGKLLTNP